MHKIEKIWAEEIYDMLMDNLRIRDLREYTGHNKDTSQARGDGLSLADRIAKLEEIVGKLNKEKKKSKN